jgi:hypothetical protein
MINRQCLLTHIDAFINKRFRKIIATSLICYVLIQRFSDEMLVCFAFAAAASVAVIWSGRSSMK